MNFQKKMIEKQLPLIHFLKLQVTLWGFEMIKMKKRFMRLWNSICNCILHGLRWLDEASKGKACRDWIS